jgi:hypothetical protein
MLARMPRTGAYPGTFDPPTIAHLAAADAALAQAGLDRLDLVVSREPLGKELGGVPTFADRIAVLEAVAASRARLAVRVTDARLIVDVAAGYDVVVMGADKWAQVVDPAWYGSEAERDEALARLPEVYVVPRAGEHPQDVPLLVLDGAHAEVSSTLARGGRVELMAPEAAAFDARTGAWTDPERYRAGLGDRAGWHVGHQ